MAFPWREQQEYIYGRICHGRSNVLAKNAGVDNKVVASMMSSGKKLKNIAVITGWGPGKCKLGSSSVMPSQNGQEGPRT